LIATSEKAFRFTIAHTNGETLQIVEGISVVKRCDYGAVETRIRWESLSIFALVAGLYAGTADAVDFRSGPVDGILSLNLAYGMLYRTESRSDDIIAIANGGDANSANTDDGTLNYDTGIASNMVGANGELTLNWGPFTTFTRAVAYYDFEQEREDREHRAFESADLDVIGSDVAMRDYYLGARFSPGGMPVIVRVGDQVINWGEASFVRDGVDTINPLDIVGRFLPVTSPRNSRVPQGMVWAAANLTETFALEAYYQYEWEPVPLPPAGSFLSGSDITGEGRRKFLQLGDGLISDLGTDLDATFQLPDGTLGFDEGFLQIPQRRDRKPDDGGQYGIALTQISTGASALKWGLHYIRYHSRLPLIGGITAGQAAIDATDPDNVAAIAAELAPTYLEQGLTEEEALAVANTTASQLALSEYANQAGYYLEYPEDISMFAATFNTATLRTGTLVAAEISHHVDVPMQLAVSDVVAAALSPVQFNPNFGMGPLGSYGADSYIPGYVRKDRTQFAFTTLQILGKRLGSVQTLVGVDGAYIHIHDFPRRGEPQLEAPGGGDADSWGYRLFAQLRYANVFGAVNLAPRVAFTHDVEGYTPAPLVSFQEGRKAVSVGLGGDYINRVTADLSYSMFFGAGSDNKLQDRDFIRLNITYWF
jgi:hypothetical protein